MPDRLSALRIVDPVLTTLATGYSNAELVSEKLFPLVTVIKEAGKIPRFGKEAFRLHATERALRGQSNRLSPEDVGGFDFVLEEHDLEYPIDYRERDEDELGLERRATFVTTEGIQLRREEMAADLAQDAANYPTGSKITLVGGDQFTDPDNSDPIGVVDDGKEAVRGKIGKEPNTMVIGAKSLVSLKNHPQLVEKIKYSMKGVLTAELLKEIFEVEEIVVGKAVYYSEADEVFFDLWTDNIVLAYVPPQRTDVDRDVYEPSYGYTLRKKGQPVVDKRDEGGKVSLVRTTDVFQVAQLGAEAGYLIQDTNL